MRDFLERHQSTLSEKHGRVLKDLAVVHAALGDDVEELSGWFART